MSVVYLAREAMMKTRHDMVEVVQIIDGELYFANYLYDGDVMDVVHNVFHACEEQAEGEPFTMLAITES